MTGKSLCGKKKAQTLLLKVKHERLCGEVEGNDGVCVGREEGGNDII